MENILNAFKLFSEKEKYHIVVQTIHKGIEFRGTNLWILIFAIFVASIGLNVNSTAVIIGAMLISPLMGPIMGLGLGMGINDLALVKRALWNYLFACGVGLSTSTIYFLLTPLNDAHSEILARVAPNVYDVLIAFFGGLAGIIATSSKQKGNVIPGAAIATALMPPLCTAGYGLATFQFSFFFGALYLFIINTVFIALATLVAVRLLKFPFKHLPDEQADQRSKRIIWGVVVLTFLPSLYFGYDIVQQNKFLNNAEAFIRNEAVFPNDYLLNKQVDPKNRAIILTYGGKKITTEEIEALRSKLGQYELEGVHCEIRQGFAYLEEQPTDDNSNPLHSALTARTRELGILQAKIDSIGNQNALGQQVFRELKTQYPNIQQAVVEPSLPVFGSSEAQQTSALVLLNLKGRLTGQEKAKLEAWLKVRLQTPSLQLIVN